MPPKTVPPHYECLGVDPSISDTELSRHYKKLSLLLHPDRAAYRNDAANEVHVQARYQRITEAYAVLSDPDKRSAYDTKHGVNFQSRLVRLQTIIGQHNTSAAQRTTAVTSTTTGADDNAEPNERDAVTQDNDSVVQEEEEEEEDYVPEGVASSHRILQQAEVESDHEYDPESSPNAADNLQEEEGEKVRKMFYLQPCVGAAGTTMLSDGELPATQYRGVSLSRRRCERAVGDANNADSQWHLCFDGNVLVGLDDAPQGDQQALAVVDGLGELLFPAVVRQVDDVMVHANTDLPRLLGRIAEKKAARAHANMNNEKDRETEPSGVDEKDSPQGSSPAVPPTAATSSSPVTEHLHLVFAFITEYYELVGDKHLLRDEDVLRAVVPEWCVASELPYLLPDVRVLSVNHVVVNSAAALRAALRDAAEAAFVDDTSAESGNGAPKRPRTSCTIVVECCNVPFE